MQGCVYLSASAGPGASHSATHTPADVSVPTTPEAFVVLTNARLGRMLPSPTLYDSGHRADDVLGVLFSHADVPPAHTTAHAALPAVTKPREDNARPLKACPRAPLLHETHAVRFRTKLGREDRVRVLVCTGHSRANRAARLLRLVPDCNIHRPPPRSSVLGWHETHPQSLPPPASAAPNQPLAPASNNSARYDGELPATADDVRVGSSTSLRVNCEPPSLRVNCEALPSLRGGAANARRHGVERKTTPVPFIRISEPEPELENEATLVDEKRKQ
ncbi:hypothetical protein K438DRAFT_2020831 [Mycena galopus ATCC 62051]|nr:hypothetical protein K438DRAFT_2020831 [Mycena galopus ATCC 62051]